MVLALNIWRHYLSGVHYTIYTDHKSLRCIIDQLNLNMRQRWWLDVVKDNDYEILYHLDKSNVVVDALSRMLTGSSIPIGMYEDIIGFSTCEFDWGSSGRGCTVGELEA